MRRPNVDPPTVATRARCGMQNPLSLARIAFAPLEAVGRTALRHSPVYPGEACGGRRQTDVPKVG
jgi:hypothetical protein